MGVKITELVPCREIEFKDLKDKIVVVDASLFLYQFLTTIRQPDGTPLMDSSGRVTSHLVGLFSRSAKLMQYGIRLAYVFDGEPPKLKIAEQERRHELKLEAKEKYKEAVRREDVEGMKKYAARTARLSREMVDEAKELLHGLGLPVVQAASEAEAQASHIVKKGDAFALATQDADALMFGATKIVRNLSLVGRKKQANKLSYRSIKPEIIDLAETLNHLGIDQDQLIALCMLVGTDYNRGGIKGIGQKGALKLVKQQGRNFEKLFYDAGWQNAFPDLSWKVVFDTVKTIPVTNNYKLQWKDIDDDALYKLLVDEHNFSQERVDSAIGKMVREKESKQQKGLNDFF